MTATAPVAAPATDATGAAAAPEAASSLPWVPGVSADDTVRVLAVPGLPAGASAQVSAASEELLDRVSVRATETDGALALELTSTAPPQDAAPEPVSVTLTLLIPTRDAVALWTPGSAEDRSWLPPSWVPPRAHSALDTTPLGCLLGRREAALVTYGVVHGAVPVHVRCGMVEESADLLLGVQAQLDDKDGVTLVVDTTTTHFETAVGAMGRRLGLHHTAVDDRNHAPVLCTWYSMHQRVSTADVLEEVALAADLGFGALIVDDGWQSSDTQRGYSTCGHWQVEASKIPDAASLVDAVAAHGMPTLWWIGTPWLGHRADAFGQLPVLHDEADMGASVLDPRSARVRTHLLGALADLLRSTGAAGLKVDFLERWSTTPQTPPPDDAVCASVPEAALSLLDELVSGHDGEMPLMLEFREPYLTAETAGRATMLRVGDCPMSPVRNLTGILDLRLTTSGAAVHSDPIMWSAQDSPERIAQHLHHALFGVPQISVRLADLKPEHRAVLESWLRFSRRHQQLLRHGTLRVSGVSELYRSATASHDGAALTVQYAPEVLTAPAGVAEWVVVNATDEQHLMVRSERAWSVRTSVTDCSGRDLGSAWRVLDGVVDLRVPPGGHVTIRSAQA